MPVSLRHLSAASSHHHPGCSRGGSSMVPTSQYASLCELTETVRVNFYRAVALSCSFLAVCCAVSLPQAPFCVHPKTGKVCVPIDPEQAWQFDPDAVPTVQQLVQELGEQQQAAGSPAAAAAKVCVGWGVGVPIVRCGATASCDYAFGIIPRKCSIRESPQCCAVEGVLCSPGLPSSVKHQALLIDASVASTPATFSCFVSFAAVCCVLLCYSPRVQLRAGRAPPWSHTSSTSRMPSLAP